MISNIFQSQFVRKGTRATISDAVQKGSQVLLFSLLCGTGPSSTFPLCVCGGAASRSSHYSLNGIETSASSPSLCMSFTGSFALFFLWKLLWNRGVDRNEGKRCCQGANEESEKKADGAKYSIGILVRDCVLETRNPGRVKDEKRQWGRVEKCQLSAPGWVILMLMSTINQSFECHRLEIFWQKRTTLH